MSTSETIPLSGTRKAAILLSLLGDEPAAMILRNLPDEDLQRVTDEVANLGQVPASGATLVVGAPKVKDATGGLTRVLALV